MLSDLFDLFGVSSRVFYTLSGFVGARQQRRCRDEAAHQQTGRGGAATYQAIVQEGVKKSRDANPYRGMVSTRRVGVGASHSSRDRVGPPCRGMGTTLSSCT